MIAAKSNLHKRYMGLLERRSENAASFAFRKGLVEEMAADNLNGHKTLLLGYHGCGKSSTVKDLEIMCGANRIACKGMRHSRIMDCVDRTNGVCILEAYNVSNEMQLASLLGLIGSYSKVMGAALLINPFITLNLEQFQGTKVRFLGPLSIEDAKGIVSFAEEGNRVFPSKLVEDAYRRSGGLRRSMIMLLAESCFYPLGERVDERAIIYVAKSSEPAYRNNFTNCFNDSQRSIISTLMKQPEIYSKGTADERVLVGTGFLKQEADRLSINGMLNYLMFSICVDGISLRTNQVW